MPTKTKPRFNPNLPDALTTETAKQIINEIDIWCSQNSTWFIDSERWYVGITNNPDARKNQHRSTNGEEPHAWKNFYARTRRIAESIETHYHKRGMLDKDSKGGSAENSYYIYVYKKRRTWLD